MWVFRSKFKVDLACLVILMKLDYMWVIVGVRPKML